tara:strand:+ start:462 stop:602 length:141 start_codon:yes stop_codon:yes gene_type:complete
VLLVISKRLVILVKLTLAKCVNMEEQTTIVVLVSTRQEISAMALAL